MPRPQQPSSPPRVRVLFVLLPDSLALDWAGPAEVLRSTNQVLKSLGLPPRFELGYIGPEPEPMSSVGLRLSGVSPLPDLHPHPDAPTWVVLVGQPGEHMPIHTSAARATIRWLRGLHPQAGALELMTICAGAVLAAHAGLLNGHEATTHHQHLTELQEAAPHCKLQSNRVFVSDGAVHTSAGVTTGIDLMLHRVSALCGPLVTARVAQALVLSLRRAPQDPQLSPFLAHREHLHPAVHRVQDAISQDPRANWTLSRMAALGFTSPRHLTRLFGTHAGLSPQAYLRAIRLSAAQQALRQGLTVNQAALHAGFSSALQLRRAWHEAGVKGTPSTLA